MADLNMQRPDDVSGVILAGGKSLRMGRDKATMLVGGGTFFEQVLQFMQAFVGRVIIAGDRPDLARSDVPCFADAFPGSAMGGLHTGLSHAQTPWVFFAPCDILHPSPELASRLLSHRGNIDVVIPRTPHGLEPTFALYHQKCLPPLEEMLQAGNYCILDFISVARVIYLDWSDEISNINTREDYESKVRKEVP